MLKKITIGVFCFLMMFDTIAQGRFSATVSPSQINKDEYTTLRLIVENSDVQKISPPSFRNFHVVSGPNQESGMTSVNGQISRYIALSFVLQPKSTGKLQIEPASAQINGKTVKSNPVKLIVSNSTGKSSTNANAYLNPLQLSDPFAEEKPPGDFNDYVLKPGENVAEKVGRNMQMRLETNKGSCYVGEPVVAEYKLYTRLKSESKLTKNPSFNGFSVIDLQEPDITGYSTGKLNGKEYNVYILRKAQLYPLQPGEIELEPATLENRVQFIKDGRRPNSGSDFFNQFSISPEDIVSQTISLSSKPVVINVKPLPEAGRPPSFTGAVGNFDLAADVEKNNFSTDETGKLLITVMGSGNLQLVTAPEITWPSGVEAFEPKFSDDLNTSVVPVTGKRTFEFSFSIQEPGSYTLSPVVFSFFDPQTHSYKTISTKPVILNVSKGSQKSVPGVIPVNDKKGPSGINNIFDHRGWMVLVLAGLIIIALIIWLIRDKKASSPQPVILKDTPDETINILATAASRYQNPLKDSEECLDRDECIEFYEILNRELKTFLIEKFGLNPLDLAYKNIMAAMDKAGVDNIIALQVEQLLHDIEWQLYTPFQRDKKMVAMYGRAQELIQVINTYLPVTQ